MRMHLATAVIASIVASSALPADNVRAELPRRIGASVSCTYFIFDGDFFGLENAFGAAGTFRYEIFRNMYFENSLGFFSTDAAGVDVDGFSSRFGVAAVLPVLIPYRPVARLGFGLLSVDPVTTTPTESFRPAQTTFYICAGAGMTRSFFSENFFVEVETSAWMTPYRYRIYQFNRYDVTVSDEWFTHLSLSLSAVYTF